jgi:hypothetical protein
MKGKICTKCGVEKPIEEFGWKYQALEKRHSVCKTCTAARSRKWYYENKERQIKNVSRNNRSYREKAREFIWDYFSAHPCSVCGETDPIVLEFHHIKGDKLMEISKLIGRGVTFETLEAEIEKCVVVCANCHRRITANEQKWFRK